MKSNLMRLGLRCFLAFALTLGVLAGFNPTLRAQAAVFQVNITTDTVDADGSDGVCADAGGFCSLRAAVMQANASPGDDSIQVPAGFYRLTIAGAGEDNAAAGDLDIKDNLTVTGAGQDFTTIDGNQLDRVFQVMNGVQAETTGLVIQGGKTNTTFGTGTPGGGIYNLGDLTLSNVRLTHNTTGDGSGDPGGAGGAGGGLYNTGSLTLQATQVFSNTTGSGGASTGYSYTSGAGGAGGGVFNSGTMTLDAASQITQNVTGKGGNATGDSSTAGAGGAGGGVFNTGSLTITGSTVTQNKTGAGGSRTGPSDNGNAGAGGSGGGINNVGTLNISGGIIEHNITGDGAIRSGGHWGSGGAGGSGGGIYNDFGGKLSADHTNIVDNAAGDGGSATLTIYSTGGDGGHGGGLFNNNQAALYAVTLASNRAGEGANGEQANGAGGCGGGVYSAGPLSLDASFVHTNQAGNQGSGGGLYLASSAPTLVNDVIYENQVQAGGSGSALMVWAATPHILQSTLYGNHGGDGSAINLTSSSTGPFSTLAITNTIMTSHSIAINITTGNTLTVDGILWYQNTHNIVGASATVSHQYTGNPAFAGDGYHLTSGSAAINRGVRSGVNTDIDGDHRPFGCWYDLGADEYQGGAICRYLFLPFLNGGKY